MENCNFDHETPNRWVVGFKLSISPITYREGKKKL